MNLSKKIFQKIVLSVVLATFIFSNTITAYAGVGNYTESSSNLSASSSYETEPMQKSPIAVFLVIAAVWGAGYAVGTIAHHAWDMFITVPTNDGSVALVQYDEDDFSNFDI
jgi:hypothetical protein